MVGVNGDGALALVRRRDRVAFLQLVGTANGRQDHRPGLGHPLGLGHSVVQREKEGPLRLIPLGLGNPHPLQHIPARPIELRKDGLPLVALALLDEPLHGVRPGRIHVGHRPAVQDHRHGLRVLLQQLVHAVTPEISVGEEQRGVQPVDQHAVEHLGVREAVDVAENRGIIANLPQHRPMRYHRLLQHEHHGHASSNQDPLQKPNKQRAPEGHQQQEQVPLVRLVQVLHLLKIHQRAHRDYDNGPEHGLGQGLEQGSEEQDHHQDGHSGDHGRQSGLGTSLVVHCRPAESPGHRHAPEESPHHIAQSQSQQLLPCVHLVMLLLGDGLRYREALQEGNERNRRRGGSQVANTLPRQVPGGRKSTGNLSNKLNTLVLEVAKFRSQDSNCDQEKGIRKPLQHLDSAFDLAGSEQEHHRQHSNR
mmetsp:Transcript_29836/g.65573  ORF Transcript_29836/g.65573 Transcript_29836/m.65573 type:complete len:420 (+) Transcript_29836:705-1964(+)